MDKLKDQGCLWWVIIGWWAAPILLILWGLKTLAEKLLKKTNPEALESAVPAEAPKQSENTHSHTVAGTSHHQEELQAMGEKNPDYALTKRELVKRYPDGVIIYEYKFHPKKAELVPDPENPYNPKAIKVFIDGVHVGYIKDGSCAHINRLLQENRIQSIKPRIIGGKHKVLDCWDGYTRRTQELSGYELEKDETTIGVRLDITELPKE